MSETCTCEYDAKLPAGTVCRWCSANRREIACDTCGEPVKPGLEEWARRHVACSPGIPPAFADIATLDAKGAALASAFEARTASMERLTAADLSTKVGGK